MLIERLVHAGAQTFAAALDRDNQPELLALWEELDGALEVAAQADANAGVADPLFKLRGWSSLGPLDVRLFALVAAYGLDATVKAAVDKATKTGLTVAFAIEALGEAAPPGTHWPDVSRTCTDPDAACFRHRLATQSSLASIHAMPSGGPLAALLGLSPAVHDFLLRESSAGAPQPAAHRVVLDPAVEVVHPTVRLLDVIVDGSAVDTLRRVVESAERAARHATQWGVQGLDRGLRLLVVGGSGLGKTRLCDALACHVKRPLIRLAGQSLSSNRDAALRTIRRASDESFYRGGLLVLEDVDAIFGVGCTHADALVREFDDLSGVVLMTSRRPEALGPSLSRRVDYRCQLRMPTAVERRHIWDIHLPPEVPVAPDVDLDAIAGTYEFTGADIARTVALAASEASSRRSDRRVITDKLLHRAARAQLKPLKEALTSQSRSHRRLSDIVLPDKVRVAVEDVLGACRNQSTVLTRWGFGSTLSTGTGITVLFDGPPGTGKTFCAEVLAAELDRPLFRVNLAEVVSKWIGETEKNLQALFQQARVGRSVLLFDEADALFSKRVSDTKSSNDRNANMEVNLLLQEMERFPGICFLTTNHFEAFDRAVVRRIAYRVTFERPGPMERARIWETLLPPAAPRAPDLDFVDLGEQYDLTGGQIKNALLRAAYWAADAGGPITQEDLERACRREYVANGKVIREVA